MKKVFAALALTVIASLTNAQSGCPFVDIGPDINLPCTQPCATLQANYFDVGSTSTYTVTQVTYSPSPYNGTPVLIGVDDQYSPAINLPFSFCFFGQSYTQFVIGSNGVISFDIANAGNGNTYTPNAVPSPFPTDLYNSIMCPWQDIDPTNQGDIYYQVVGTYPCRKFVISWVNVPYYGDPNSVSTGSCPSPLFATQQIVLYETTNVVEINIQNKESCPGWVGGVAVEGIQDATGGTAYTVPGRNATVWTTQNDSWQFIPSGPSIVSLSWALNGVQVGTGTSYTTCPSTYGLYSCTATYQPCPGNNPVTVTDYMFLQTKTLSVNIDSVLNPTCGQNNGIVYASYNTTSTVLDYGWDTGVTGTTTLNGVGPGTYIFHTDISGCTRSDTATLIDTGSVSVVVNDSAFVSCSPPGTAGALCATVVGGTAPFTYAWSNAQTGACIGGLTAGNYIVTLTDGAGCTASDNASVTYTYQSPSLGPPQITNVSCNGGTDGRIILNPVNLQPPVNYQWSGGLPNNDTVSNLSASSFAVTATDVNGCSATDTYTVTQPSPIVIGNPAITQATCSAGGTIVANASGGTGTLTFGWSNGQTGIAINNLAAGPYDLTVTDQNLCSATATYTVTAASNVITFGAPVIVDDACNGGTTGSITANASGGTGTITLVWSNTQTGSTISNLAAGTYSVTATDVNSCSASTSYVIAEPTAVVFGPATIDTTTCNAGGQITVSASGGTGTISFAWSNGGTGATVTNVAAGPYTVTATDQNLCTATASYTVQAGAGAIFISNPIITNVNCFGGNNGSISITTSGGNGTITTSWSNGGSGNTISGLTAGNYSVTASDANACSTTASYTITQPAALVIDSAHVQNIGCAGGTGSITVFVSGGTINYSYQWMQQSNSQSYNGQTISNLAVDTYDITVTDANSCSVTGSYTVTQVTPLTFTTSTTNVSCNGGNDGTATVTVTTGTAPYAYNWNGAGATANATLTGISAGTVNVTITDVNCSATASFTITEPSAITILHVGETAVSCNGGSDGTESISVNGGTPPYTYLWSNGQTVANATGLPAGQVGVTVTDSKSCTAIQGYIVTEPAPVFLSLTPSDALCHGASNGTVSATASGGNPPYTYLWSNLQATQNLPAVPAGNYSATVTDANSCTASASTTVNEPADLIINALGHQVLCIGDANGSITVNASGGTQPYNFSATQDFTNFVFATNDTIKGLAVGTYQVVVADDNGCTKVTPATVPNATPDLFTHSTDSTSCYGTDYHDGAAHVISTTLLNGPYTYSIDGGEFQDGGDFFGLTAGSHVITARNYNGCLSTITVFVPEPLPIVVNVIPDSLFLSMGQAGAVQVTYLNASNVTYLWTPFTGLSCADCANPSVLVYQSGDYQVMVSTTNGTSTCFATASLHVQVTDTVKPFIPSAFSPNGDGNNDVFQIFGTGIKTVDLKIFNRWGEMVYKSNNQFAGWDGSYKGELQMPGVFTYTTVVTFLDDRTWEKSGSITLIR